MHTWVNVFAGAFTSVMMFSAAAATSDQEIRRVYAERRLLVRAFLANVVVVPVLAAALLHAFQLRGDLAMGVALAAICPGAPFGTFLALRTRGDVALDVALAVILTCGLTVVALFTTPITSRLLFGPGKMVALPRGLGVLVVALIVLVPVMIGQAVRRRSASAVRIAKIASLLTFILLMAANVAAGGLRSSGMREVGWRGSALILSLVIVSMGAGWLAGLSPSTRTTLATSTGLRNAGLAFLFSEYSFPGTQAQLGVAAYSILMLVPNFLFAAVSRRWRARRGPGPAQ